MEQEINTIDQYLYNYVLAHPVLASIFIPLVLGIIISFAMGFVIYVIYGKDLDNKPDNWKIRLLTFIVASGTAILTLLGLDGAISSIWLKGMFLVINTSVPFGFYHLKGKELIQIIINKFTKKVNDTDI